jgi:hypothetical protein
MEGGETQSGGATARNEGTRVCCWGPRELQYVEEQEQRRENWLTD